MNRLFMSLYLDEDVDVLVADLLRARGFDVTTTVDAGRRTSSDDEQLAYATGHQKVLVTHNRVHFERLAADYLAAGRSHWGIVVAIRRSPYEIARRLLRLLDAVAADEMQDQVRYV